MKSRAVPAGLDRGPFAAATALPMATRDDLLGPAYRRLLRGVYQAADLPVTHAATIRAARQVVGSDAVLVGPSAAWALGCEFADADEPAHIGVPHGWVGGQALLARHRMRVAETEVVRTRFGPATSAIRTALDLARGIGTGDLPYWRRVAWVDALLRTTGTPSQAARGGLVAGRGLHGIGTARRVLLDARDGVDSPRETQLRLLVLGRGFPEPVVQCPVADRRGEVFARLDLGWPQWRTGLEYDGAVHREYAQHSRDLARHNRIREAGWFVVQVDSRALSRPEAFIRQLAGRILVPDRA